MIKKIVFLPVLTVFLSFNAYAEEVQNLNLSLQESIDMAIKRNLDLNVESYNPKIQELETQKIRDAFGLYIGANPGLRGSSQPTANSFISGNSLLSQFNQNYDFYVTKRLESGGEISVNFNNAIASTNSTRVDFNPTFSPALSLSFSHPILRNAFLGTRRIMIGENQNEASVITLRSKVIDTITLTKTAYWDVVSAKLRLQVFQNSLKLSEQLLKDNEARLKAGFASKVDILNAQTTIASRQESIYQTQKELGDAQDRLKRLINPDEKYFPNWQFNINATDKPDFTIRPVTIDESYKKALEKRPDYQINLINSKNLAIQTDISNQNRLPLLNFNGSAGLQSIDRTYIASVGQLFGLKGYFWNVGLNFELPVQGNVGETEYQQAKLNQQKQDITTASLKQKIYNDIRNAVRAIEVNRQRIGTNNKAKQLADEQLKAENEKLKAGFSTSFQVLQYQRDFEQAGLNEVNATIDYLKSLNTLDQVEGTSIEQNNLQI